MENNESTQIFNAYQQQETGEITFHNLPENIQSIAAESLKSLLTATQPNEEQAIIFARSVRSAFTRLFNTDD